MTIPARMYPNYGNSNVPGKETFHLKVFYGASAPATYYGPGLVVETTATGKITVTFPRSYRRLIGFRAGYALCAAGAVLFPVILSSTITTDGKLIIETRLAAGTATDPANGDHITYEFDVSNDLISDGSVTV